MSDKNSFKQLLKKAVKPFARLLISIGIYPRRMVLRRNYFRYASEYQKFKKLGGKITHIYPIVLDYDDQAGAASGHYFHQDLLVASLIHEANPVRHIDIASRIDGFVAHVAAFRKIDIMDVRNLGDTGHKNISFIKADLMNENSIESNATDSISCLHAIEHFGLGRYGDPLDVNGHIKGFNNILRMLSTNGTLYISFPIGKTNEIHFNAHRVFHPKDIFTWPHDPNSILLKRFDYVDDAGNLHQNIDLQKSIPNVSYGCGIYTFKKLH